MELKPGYKQTEAGVIPEDWKVQPLSELAIRITDGEHLTPKRTTDGYYLLSARNIQNGHIELSDVDYIGEEEYQRIRKRCNPEQNDVLISCSGTIGRVAIVPYGLSCALVRSAALVKSSPKKLCGLYNQYFLQSFSGQKQIQASLNQGAQPNLFLSQINKLLIATPPTLAEQEAIAEALSDADELIESLEQLIAKKRHIKQGALQQLLRGRVRINQEAWNCKFKKAEFGKIPEDWDTDYVENLATVTTGDKNTQDRIDDGQYPFFVRSQTIERINSYTYDGEAVLTAGDGVGTGKVYHYINGKFDAHQRVYRISDFSERINGYFFYLYFSTNFYTRIMQMTAKSSVDSVRREMITRMSIPIPLTKIEQDAIASAIFNMDEEISALETKLSKARQIKQGMMQELLTGRIRLI